MMPELRLAAAALALCSLHLQAQRPQPGSAGLTAASGLYKVVFQVPEGKINVNFPNDQAAGDTVLALVFPEPAGKDRTELDRNSASLSTYRVELDGARIVADGFLRWTAPSPLPSGFATVRLRDRSGRVVTRCDVPVTPKGADLPEPAATASFLLPSGGRSGAPVSLWGAFPEDIVPVVRVGGLPALVIARSPRRVVFISPAAAVGASTLEVRFGAATPVTGPFRLLAMQSSATETNLRTGQTATMTVRVSGLSGISAPAALVLANHSPATVALSGGDSQTIAIQAADVGPDGTYQLTRTLTGKILGAFQIEIDVSLPPSAQLPIEQLAALSLDRWSRRSNVPVAPDARRLIVDDVLAARPLLDQYFLAQLAFHADPVSLLDSLLRDYCFDLRDSKLTPAFRFAPLAFAPQAVSAGVSIESSDVRRNTFLQYLGQLLARLTPTQPVGLLVVTSQPDKQQIKIGSKTGLDYFTARSFHLTSGDYRISVGGCTEQVKVRTNQQSTVHCTRK